METALQTLKTYVNPEFLVKNIYLFGILVAFLGIYGPRLHPKLPPSLRALFDNMVFRSVIIFIILYLSNRDLVASLTIMIIFIITINILHTTNVIEKVSAMIYSEKFTMQGPPVANCKIYNTDETKKIGNTHYPLNDTDAANLLRGNSEYTGYPNATVDFSN